MASEKTEYSEEEIIKIKYDASQIGIKQGMEHTTPSKPTIKELNLLKISMVGINSKLDSVLENVGELKVSDKENTKEHKEIRKDLRDFIDAANNKFEDKAESDRRHAKCEETISEFIKSAKITYAPKWVANVWLTIFTTFGMAVLGFFVNMVIKS